MKNKIFKTVAAGLMTGMLVMGLAGCGDKTGAGAETGNTSGNTAENTTGTTAGTTGPGSIPSINGLTPESAASSVCQLSDISKYVTIDSYKGMEVALENDYASIDVNEMATQDANSGLVEASPYVSEDCEIITDRPVEIGDLTDIDFAGYKDGVAFDGGTSEHYKLLIGSGNFIPGFEEGLVGVNPGETVSLDLSFPENYHSADLAGQTVVFEVTVHGIVAQSGIIEAWNYINGQNAATFEDVVAFYVEQDQATLDDYYDTDLQNGIGSYLLENAVFHEEFPESLKNQYQVYASNLLDDMASYYTQYYYYYYGVQYSFTPDSVAQQMGYADATDYITNKSYQDLQLAAICKAIADKEGISVTDDVLNSRIVKLLKENGYDDTAASNYIKNMNPAELEQYRDEFLQEDVLILLKANCTASFKG